MGVNVLPAEQEAMTRPSKCNPGFSNFTATHPRAPPMKNVNPTLMGMNHLQFVAYAKQQM